MKLPFPLRLGLYFVLAVTVLRVVLAVAEKIMD